MEETIRVFYLAWEHAKYSLTRIQELLKWLIQITPGGETNKKTKLIGLAAITASGLILDPCIMARFLLFTLLHIILSLSLFGARPDGDFVYLHVFTFVAEYLYLVYRLLLLLLEVLRLAATFVESLRGILLLFTPCCICWLLRRRGRMKPNSEANHTPASTPANDVSSDNRSVSETHTESNIPRPDEKNRGFHIHRSSSVSICSDFIHGKCSEVRCGRHHSFMPYHWQYRPPQEDWVSFSPADNDVIERCYSDPSVQSVPSTRLEQTKVMVLSPESQLCTFLTYKLNFGEMQLQTSERGYYIKVRRLSTPPSLQEPSNALETKWVWYWRHNKTWKQYGDETGALNSSIQRAIEDSYLQARKSHDFSTRMHHYRIFFLCVPIIQRNRNPEVGTKRKVRRRPLYLSKENVCHTKTGMSTTMSAASLPSHWSVVPPDKDYIRVELLPTSGEYQEVQKNFTKSIRNEEARVIRIERVQNPFMCEKFNRKREQMERKKPSGHNLQKLLFHGTSPDVVEAICQQNFDWRVHGRNATAYGEGSYFAVHASYSNKYCHQDIMGKRFMFLASVLVGDFVRGQKGYQRPPVRNVQTNELYDSCVDNERKPALYVTFDVDQCYPTYLIEYNCIM